MRSLYTVLNEPLTILYTVQDRQELQKSISEKWR